PPLVDQEEVEEVPAHFHRRSHRGVDLELVTLREGRELGREDRLLDGARPLQLLVQGQQPLAVPRGRNRPLEEPGVLDGGGRLQRQRIEQLQIRSRGVYRG